MRSAVILLALLATGGVAAAGPNLADRQRSLTEARRAGAVAQARADRLAAAASAERDAAAKAAADERALAARVGAAEADLATAGARAALVDRLLADQRARLATAQAPVARLLAALQSLAARPAIVAVAQPGSVDDLVHLRAVLGGALPVIRARTAGVRTELERTRGLRADAVLAARAIGDSRARLERERRELAALEASHRGRALALGRGAITESDRALALGEEARDLIDRMTEDGEGQAVVAGLSRLPGPVARPMAVGVLGPPAPRGVLRMPVAGRLVTGFGEISEAGVRSRGLSFVTAPGATVVAPAGGRVRYARRFGDYGMIVVIDHGDGWTSLLSGLSRVGVKAGAEVAQGQTIGRAVGGEQLPLTVEVRRRGRPIDAAALAG
ncbi:murein hydrolase activator EnvC family protein [Sphingomonas sp. Leaf343]|uniref:murein hydrolase activator EnvC family protein n=1 Tax=Sphingomonas sp. Leaf343 TaxID=1736345 RepID=UPI000A77E920|nr:peptidoglycan DD-metalloendopeptidase family protein [Sphingomonas sp. Leaf343]